jgi:phage shock protein C
MIVDSEQRRHASTLMEASPMADRLYRSRADRIFTGVAGGLAERLGADPSLVRLVWALLVIFTGGLALVVYIVTALVVPEEPELASAAPSDGSANPATRPTAQRRRGEGAAIVVGVFLVILGGYLLLRQLLPELNFDWFGPLVLIGLGVLLLFRAVGTRPGDPGSVA